MNDKEAALLGELEKLLEEVEEVLEELRRLADYGNV